MKHGSLELASLILELFKGRKGTYAAQAVLPDGRRIFQPVEKRDGLGADLLLQGHLNGDGCYGFYLITEERKVWCSCVDFDDHQDRPDPRWRDKAAKLHLFLQNIGLSALVEISYSGQGAHVWLFFAEQICPAYVRKWWGLLAGRAGVSVLEVYPRQDSLDGLKVGSLVRFPLAGGSGFADSENDWTLLDPARAMRGAKRYHQWELSHAIARAGVDVADLEGKAGRDGNTMSAAIEASATIPQSVQNLIDRGGIFSRRWHGDAFRLRDASNSGIAQALAYEMVKAYVPTPEIELALRAWIAERSPKKDRDDWIRVTINKAYRLSQGREKAEAATSMTLRDAVELCISDIERGRSHFGTGIEELDGAIRGVSPGELAIVAARTSHGKSAFGFQWVDHITRNGDRAVIISEEMTASAVGQRYLQRASELDIESCTKDHARRLRWDTESYFKGRADCYLLDNVFHIDQVCKQLEYHAEYKGVKVALVDYLQIVGSSKKSEYDKVTEVSGMLKQSARKTGLAVIALCQINRQSELRENREPEISDLRGSGQIEQDADLILILFWRGMYDRDAPPDEYLVKVGKRRNGRGVGTRIITTFDSARQRIGQTADGVLPENEEVLF